MENQLLIAALKAQLIVLRAEFNIKAQYEMNRDFIMDCRVLSEVIDHVEIQITELEKQL